MKAESYREFPVGLVVKDSVLSLLGLGFDPLPCRWWARPKKKKKKGKKKKAERYCGKSRRVVSRQVGRIRNREDEGEPRWVLFHSFV